MAKNNMVQDILENAAEQLGRFVGKVRRADKRFLILSGVAVVLVIIMLSIIVHSIRANKADEEITTTNDISNIYELPSEEYEDEAVVSATVGKYRINTGDSPFLNMRLAADKNAEVVTKVPNGTEIEVMFIDDYGVGTDSDYGWGYIEYNGKRGWVYMEYLTK